MSLAQNIGFNPYISHTRPSSFETVMRQMRSILHSPPALKGILTLPSHKESGSARPAAYHAIFTVMTNHRTERAAVAAARE